MIEYLNNEFTSSKISENIKNQIFKYVVEFGSFKVSDLVDKTGYSTTTILKYVKIMQENGFLIPMGKIGINRKGRKSVEYGIKSNSYFFIGVDIKNFELNIAIMDFIGNILLEKTYYDFVFANDHQTLDNLCNHITDFINNLDNISSDNISYICINISGRVNAKKGTSASIFNFEDTQDSPLSVILSERIGKNVCIENDTKSMAYGEYLSGLNKKYKNLLYVNISWGLGIGIIIYGNIYYGKDGYSGEFGHVQSYNNNIMCHCGKKGCLETEVSGNAIHRKLLERIKSGEASILSKKVKEGSIIKLKDIIEAADKEDPLSIELIEQTGTELGHQLAGLINIFNPEAIIIGGILSEADPNYFIKSTELAIKKYSLKLMSQNVKIISSELKDRAGVVGACFIARAHLLNIDPKY
jgi:Transcriptional regulator/sugar kinase